MSENTKTIGWISKARVVKVIEIEGHQFIATSAGLRTECHKCLGRGGFDAYLGLHNGVCYTCNGSGLSGKTYDDEAAVTKSLRAAERREARRQAKFEAEQAEAAAKRDEWVSTNPALAARLTEIAAEVYIGEPGDMSEAAYEAHHAGTRKYGDFIMLMASHVSWKALTEGQTTAVAEAIVEVDAKIKAAEEKVASQRYLDAVAGDKITATGTVAVATTVDTTYGMSRLVVIEGTGDFEGVTFKMFGTGATLWETAKGDTVEVAGAVKGFEEYNDTPQTVLTRAKVKTLTAA